MVEIYNETIQDLLSNDVKVLELRTQGNKINLPGILEMDVTTAEDIQKIMDLGNKNRAVAATKMNSTRYAFFAGLTIQKHLQNSKFSSDGSRIFGGWGHQVIIIRCHSHTYTEITRF